MSGCGGHGPWHHGGCGCGAQAGWGGYGSAGPGYGRSLRRTWRPAESDLEDYIRDLEDEVRAVRSDLEQMRRSRQPGDAG